MNDKENFETLPAFIRLKQLKGLEIVIECLDELIKKNQWLKLSNEKSFIPNLNIVIKGNPGTGKTTAAKLIGEIYYESGLLERGHIVSVSRTDLVATYVGQTALKTAQKITEAMGGVLFIDEAYTLVKKGTENDFGQEAIDTIMEAMTNYMGQFAVVIAGYPQKIDEFIATNPGLSSRFSAINTLTIPDYTPDILQHIFEEKVKKEGRQISPELQQKLPYLFENIYAEREDESFGNARDVLTLYAAFDANRCNRIIEQSDGSERMLLTIADVPSAPENYHEFLSPRQPDDLESILKQLDHLIGLDEVKDTIGTLITNKQVEKLRGTGSKLIPGHYLFLGNPGTGKTTVARLMGKIFKNLGLLKKGNVIEVGRSDLVAGYSGQTALNVKSVLESSFDNILFIDEAYQLINDERDTFGKEAVETLLATMENDRDKICIIMAGYPERMQELVQSNPGFTSRIENNITFANYKADEMLAIFVEMAKDQNFNLADAVKEKLMVIFKIWEKDQSPTFGNGRDVRNLLSTVRSAMNSRILKNNKQKIAVDLYRIEPEDIPNNT